MPKLTAAKGAAINSAVAAIKDASARDAVQAKLAAFQDADNMGDALAVAIEASHALELGGGAIDEKAAAWRMVSAALAGDGHDKTDEWRKQ